jgi:hypothetical protein
MLNHGIPVIIVSRRLGHAKPSITLDVYGHLIPSLQAEAAQKINELITPVEFYQLHQTAPNCTTTAPRNGGHMNTPPHMAFYKQKPPHIGVF